ncbi:MAG: FkbM family methyltransferase [Magnetococcales bacterium]|nr:FkbM family methyltransferase [Magnetococcales bacterium]
MPNKLPLVQRILLWLHATINRSGLLSSMPGRWFFETCYIIYKSFFEARGVEVLRRYVAANGWIIDVGANIGFFTAIFANWVQDANRVLALEPEPVNFERLRRRMARHRRIKQIDFLCAAAAEKDGVGFLHLNPNHPADHRLSTSGISIDLVTLDTLMERRGWPMVSLIKIDVQGAENRVLMGGKRLIQRYRPALFVELTLNEPGSLATMAILAEWNYHPHRIHHGKGIRPVTTDELSELLNKKGYLDCLFLPHP